MRTIVLLCFFLAMVRTGAAQTCTGGLGDPIVNITFGQAVNNGQPLSPGVTNLSYVSGTCPSDGQYTIIGHTSGCFGNTWVSIGQDHTGNQAGLFMLINASYQPSDFYLQKVDGLCPGTTYQFAAWIMNVVSRPNEILPNLTFQILTTGGQALATYQTGDVAFDPSGKWVQYAFYFTTPPGTTSVMLRMANNAPGGNGNDLAVDDITFRAAGPTVQLAVAGFPTDTINVCDYDQQAMVINATVESCYPSQQLQWQQSGDSGVSWKDIPGATALQYARPKTLPGYYLYRLLVAQTGNLGITTCEVASPDLVVNVIKAAQPAVTISTDQPAICLGLPTTFHASATDGGGGPHYQWLVNGMAAGQDSAGFTTSSLLGGELVRCVLTSNAACDLNPTVLSNILALPGIPVPVQGLGIAASATAICADSLVQFVARPVNGGATPSFQWQVDGVDVGKGPTFSDAGLKDGDIVNCIMVGSLTCSQPVPASPPVKMTVYPLPVIRLDSMVIIGGGQSIPLQPVITGDVVKWNWSPADGLDNASVASPLASPVISTSYQLYVVTAEGCHTAASELVEVYYPLRMPGAFTPNGDGRNDVFRVPAITPVRLGYLAVFNRVGQRVFYSEDKSAGWDGLYNGVAQPAGTYVWELVFVNPITKKIEERKGTVILVR